MLKPLDMEEMCQALKRAVLEAENIRFLRKRSEQTQELRNLSLLEEADGAGEDPVVEMILGYLHDNYQEKIMLSDLEEELHYSERYINRKFQKAMGTTVIEYLNRYRIQKALLLIQEGKLAVSDIGYECGIGDYKYFNHVFKKYIGCSVKEYKARIG